MFRSRFFWQLFSGYAVVVVVFAAIVEFAVSDWVAEDSLRDIRESLRAKATLLREISRDALDGKGDRTLQSRVHRLGAETGTRLTVIDAGGVVLADSEEQPARMDNHRKREEVVGAIENGVGFSTRFSHTVKHDMMYCALSVRAAGTVLGFVRASLALRAVDGKLSRARDLVLLGATIAGFVALLLGIVFARRVTSRLDSMTEAAQAMADGDDSRRVVVSDGGEIGKLATAFNSMAEQLQDRIGKITADRNTVQAILESMVEGVVAVDRHESVLHMNSVAGDILDVDPASVIGRRIWEAARVNEIARSLGASLEGERVYRSQARIMRGGGECLLDISASPLTDADGTVTGAVVVFHDVTEIHRLEVVRRDFVVNASHELKTPITAIRGFLESMVEDPDMPGETRDKFLRRASAQSERLSLLVTDLLQLSRFEAADETGIPERIDLREIANHAVAGLQGVAAERGIVLTAAHDAAPVHVMGDAATFALVVDNLVDNAIKYTGDGGHVAVRAVVREGSAFLEVEDDGIGIVATDLDRIFERFYRVDKARSRAVGGTGLGLAIVKHACGILHGDLTVSSELGRGSTFRVGLPLADA